MNEFERFIIKRIDEVHEELHVIERKISYFVGVSTVIASIISILVTKII